MTLMTAPELQALFDRVRRGDLDPSAAAGLILTALRAAPFEDMGFARVDTHRELRQGFPEVILGTGKTPSQIAAIAEKIVAHGQALLVTRADPEAYDAVRARVPGATYHPVARAITLAQGDVPAGKGTILIACAGTAPVAFQFVSSLSVCHASPGPARVDESSDVLGHLEYEHLQVE